MGCACAEGGVVTAAGDPTMGKLKVLALVARGARTDMEALKVVFEAWQMGFGEAADIYERQRAGVEVPV